MNYTGFVKIVKKHDKTLPQLKGKYKKDIKSSKICDEGKDADKLCEHMEHLYANWFCDRSTSFTTSRSAASRTFSTDNEREMMAVDGSGELVQVGKLLIKMEEHVSQFLAPVTSNPTCKFTKRTETGGECCDACGKTRQELGVTHMDCCKLCDMMHCCCVQCQSNAWNAGHKCTCRKPGQI